MKPWYLGTLIGTDLRALYRAGDNGQVFVYIPDRNEALRLTKAEAAASVERGECEPQFTWEFYEHRWNCAPENSRSIKQETSNGLRLLETKVAA